MKREDNPKYFEHLCLVIKAVFAAETDLQPQLSEDLRNKKITPDEYIERVADKLLSRTDAKDIDYE